MNDATRREFIYSTIAAGGSLGTASSVILAAALALAPPAAASSKFLSWEGKWHLNIAETHYPSGFPIITSNDIDVTKDNGKALRYSETVIIDGKSSTESYEGAYDDKPRPIGTEGWTIRYRHISASTLGAVRRNTEGVIVERSSCAISPDGKKFTCHVWTPGRGSRPVTFVEIFDKLA